jgi:type III pantothenate kinase
MNLVIDIGNSSIKYALIDADQVIEVKRLDQLEDLARVVEPFYAHQIAICSVHYTTDHIIKNLPHLEKAIFLNKASKMPLSIAYDTPETLGMDRLAAAIGAFDLFPQNALLIIDVGSCITYDLVHAHTFHGGLISPGIDLRYRAMSEFTANLPLINSREAPASYIGKSTYQSMSSGVINGILGEMEYHISQLLLKYSDLKVIMTGGDAHLFESKINSNIFVALEIVLLGLNRVLKDNA